MKTYKKLKFVELRELGFWDTKRYLNISDKKFKNNITLSDVLIPYKKKISKREMIEKKYAIISKINFGGELFLRDLNNIENYKGDIYLVPDNSIIYSKINVKHGCIFYNDKGNTPFGVSSEYPIFTFDNTIVSGKFLQKLLRTQEFKKLLDSKATGISKARVKQADFLATRVPLPPLSEQETIVKNYYDKITQATTYEQQAETLEKNIENYLFESLGIEELDKRKKIGLNIIESKRMERWDIPFLMGESSLKSKYSIHRMGEYIVEIATGTTPPTSRKEYFRGDINFYTPSDINNKILLNADRKVSLLAVKDKKVRVFKKNTLLFVGIGSTVGKVGIIGNEFATSNQQITGFNVDENMLLTEYVYYYFTYFKNVTTKEQTKATLPIVNQEKIMNILIPIPPKETQQAIINQIDTYKNEIKILRERATLLKQQAEQEFEQTIFS
ncbi:restriction endonuclease subunit S [Capnocytophaga genosp. AHN8471]|uniref:restriction endonuclease subunit S n=1 Tax=Capnocytophaga genosp. AHN8471 TaxID=327574 RepID=UPI001933CCDA|nr:restriction endonuclease subunit S [Capnocytophaga genosp. AHN8471]MBM0658899.1 restriction endonuclease subunit S [Capnocytophaga genosp. AHN8471]